MVYSKVDAGRSPGAWAAVRRFRSLDVPQGYPGHAHFWDRAISRRNFLQTAGAAGLILGSGLVKPASAGKPAPSEPNPIPGGFQIEEGGEVFHNFGPGVFDPIDSDRSAITDFNGLIGYAILDGTGTGRNTATNQSSPLLFEVDLRFMQGVYVGTDGKHRFSTFSLI